MNIEEAKQHARVIADKLQEPASVIPYGGAFIVETKANAIAHALRRVYDTDGWNAPVSTPTPNQA